MAVFNSIDREKSRRILLIFFVLSTILPLLILLYFVSQYVSPSLSEEQHSLLKEHFCLLVVVMLGIPFLGYLVMSRLISSLEGVTREIEIKSSPVIGLEKDPPEENEIRSLFRMFDRLIHSAEDSRAERDRLEELLAKLIAVSTDLTSELDFDRLFAMVLQRVTEVMAAERTSLYVIDWERREIWTKVAQGVRPIRLPLGTGISGRVAESGETLNIVDAWDLDFFDRSFDRKNNFRTKSVLCAPIKNRSGERIGVLQVINKKGTGRFQAEDEILLRCLTSQVGIALENALLHEELMVLFNSSITTLSAMVDARHPFTAGHSHRVTAYSLMIGDEMGLSPAEMEELKFAALLHDIGKIGIPDKILLKNGAFSSEERKEMETHPVKTRRILENFHFPKALRGVIEIAVHHHEKVNGEGYPDHLTADILPLGSRILAVADVFDALTSPREYPKYAGEATLGCLPMPLTQAISILKSGAGKHFDPDVIEAFMIRLPKALIAFRGDHFPPAYIDPLIRETAPELLKEVSGFGFRVPGSTGQI